MARSIILERDAVHKPLGRIAQVAGRTATAPILGHALIEPDAEGIRVTGTDLDIWLSVTLPAKAGRFGPLALPAKEFHDVIAALPAGAQAELTWSEDATAVRIKAGRARFTLPLMAASDFPASPRGENVTEFTAAAGVFNAMLERTRWAAGKEETRYYLNGVYLHIAGERLTCVATDGHLLGRCDGAVPEGAADLKGVIVPTAAVKLIGALIGDIDDDIALAVSEVALRLDRGDEQVSWSIATKLIDGTFPDYARVIPARHGLVEVDVEAAALAGALARVAILTPDAGAVMLEGAKGLLTLSTQGPDGREAAEEIDASWRTKPPARKIGFNPRHLKAALEGIAADTVVLALNPDADGACILTPRGRNDTLALIMPARM